MDFILYEDKDIIVVKKPAGLESQSSKGFEPDMVSKLRRHLTYPQTIHKSTTIPANRPQNTPPPYVGVIHRLDKPVSGVMVYAKNQKAAASLSASLQAGKMKKWYAAVVCGKPVDNQGTYVDYLLQDRKTNCSRIVDKSVEGSKKAELNYRVKEVINREGKEYSLVEIELLTGRHHQIRVQFAGHGTPLVGDERYGERREKNEKGRRLGLALCAVRLEFPHPGTGEEMRFEMEAGEGAFGWF